MCVPADGHSVLNMCMRWQAAPSLRHVGLTGGCAQVPPAQELWTALPSLRNIQHMHSRFGRKLLLQLSSVESRLRYISHIGEIAVVYQQLVHAYICNTRPVADTCESLVLYT